ncbi:hypothetical protein JHK85_017321 [Glycine max]|nr:hypothetical protein JHK85_017321 [Glycine max]
MDVAAGILGFEAEIAQNKVKHLRLWIFECREPGHQTFMLGLGAAVLLGLAHAITNLLGGCNCISSQQEFEKASSRTMSNNRSDDSCGFSHHHFLSIGGICCFVHGLFCIAYYVSATASMD